MGPSWTGIDPDGLLIKALEGLCGSLFGPVLTLMVC